MTVFFRLVLLRVLSHVPHLRFGSRNLKLWLMGKKMLLLAHHQILTPFFYAWHSIELESPCVGDSRQSHFYFFLRAFTRLAMYHIGDIGAFRIPIYTLWAFERYQF